MRYLILQGRYFYLLLGLIWLSSCTPPPVPEAPLAVWHSGQKLSPYHGLQNGTNDVTELEWLSAINAAGPLRVQGSAADKRLSMQAAPGIIAHAEYDLAGLCQVFRASATVSSAGASAVFQVQLDQRTVWQSPALTQADGVVAVNLDVTGIGRLRLQVRDTAGLASFAQWLNPQLDCLVPTTVQGLGLSAEYFAEAELSGPSIQRLDGQLDFNWGQLSPVLGLPPGVFSARWTGWLEPSVSGETTIFLPASGLARLYLDDQLIASSTAPGTLSLQAGQRYALRLEFHKTQPTAALRLEWQRTGGARELISQHYLQPAQLLEAQSLRAGQNLLLNSDFSAGLAAWQLYGTGTASTVTPGQDGSGQALQALNWAWIQQNLAVSDLRAGESFGLRAYGRSLGTGVCIVGFAGGNAKAETFRKQLTFRGGWQEQQDSLTMPAGTTWAGVYMVSEQSACQFDEVRLILGEAGGGGQGNNELLLNGGFEEQSAHWRSFGGTSRFVSQAASGQRALELSDWGWWQQDLPFGLLEAGRVYHLSAQGRAMGASACQVGFVAASSAGLLFSEVLTFSARSWRGKQLERLMPEGVSWAAVYLAAGPDACRFDELSLSIQELPAPAQFQATVLGSQQVQLSWEAVSGAERYVLERRSANGAFSPLTEMTQTSYSDSAVVANSHYVYRLRARKSTLLSEAVEVEATTPPTDLLGAADAWQKGHWSQVFSWPLVGIHAVLLPDGRVLTYGTNGQGQQGAFFIYSIWDPKKGLAADAHTVLPNTTNTDIFCSAQLVLPNGLTLITGGDAMPLGNKNAGIPDVTIFDYRDLSLEPSPLQMLRGRWYPTATLLPNQEILVYGGIDGTRKTVTIPEVFDGTAWRLLTEAENSAASFTFPWNFVAPNGQVFHAGWRADMYYLDPSGSGSMTLAGRRESLWRSNGSAAMFDTGRILVAGGSNPGRQTALVIDINNEAPVVTTTQSMHRGRTHFDLTILANGEVLASGGSVASNTMEGVAYEAEWWNPESGVWTLGAAADRARLYHSSAVLLPDASVLTAGGGAPGPQRNLNAEIFYPHYLFRKDGSGLLARRPVIAGMFSQLNYNQTFTITTPDANSIGQVSFIALGSTTHSFNMGQRFLSLDILSRDTGSLSVRAPANANLAPPGYYMVFIIDDEGVPSEAQIVRIQ